MSPWRVAKELVREHGVVKGLFAGIGPTLLREGLGTMAYFGVYEQTKRSIMKWRGLSTGGCGRIEGQEGGHSSRLVPRPLGVRCVSP